jgi:CheY-like chemotaxis protein
MSHELRTPLNAILGFSGIVRKDPLLPENERQNLEIINRSGEHLLTLINDVLEMAKIEAGGVQLSPTPFDLGDMVRDVTDMMQMRAKEKGLQLDIDQSSKFPRYIVGDEPRLRQVLINLIGNAIKYTEQGSVAVHLGTKHNENSHLLIEVEDSGPGIAAQDQPRIFEPFIQLGEHGISKGTGLGLTITRQYVQMMGGNISLESTLGKGSLFRIELPLAEVTEADIVKTKQVAPGNVVGLTPGQKQYRLLIVEDQPDNQALLTQLMERVGLQIRVAENGQQGVELFQSWQPHLILMDRRMPVMDGEEATRHIRKLPGGQEVKIIAVTASAFKEQREKMFDAGMDDIVGKPYHPGEIYACLSKQLGIQFEYEGTAETREQARTLTPEMLSVLPDALRNELREAVESLENERIDQAIQQVAAHDQELKQTLTQLAEAFDYPAILQALKSD